MISIASGQSSTGKALLRGKLVGFGEVALLEIFSELQYLLPQSANINIPVKRDSTFEAVVPLQSPAYFRLGRNKLYLSPGDALEVFIDREDAGRAIIKGKGSQANIYLKDVPFPKGGSYLEAGKNIKPEPSETYALLVDIAKRRTQTLNALRNVSPEFKRLELGRIRADLIISIQKIPGYVHSRYYQESESFRVKYTEEFNKIARPTLDSLCRNFVDPAMLQVEPYRDIVGKLDLDANKDKAQVSKIRDWQFAMALANSRIKPLTDKSRLNQFDKSVDSIATKSYRNAIKLLIADKRKFGTGDMAVDFKVKTDAGTETSLSSLKGKVIYIDIWATWCGPCLADAGIVLRFRRCPISG